MANKLFIVPDVYTDFHCKISACRQSCCRGWRITVSMEEYFRLLGLSLGKKLRQRMDGALYKLDSPTKEKYAEFCETYDGDCPLHDSDGYCALQRHCGEGVMTSVCRYYPRSPRTLHGYECALSASCEGVCDLLFSKKDKMTFIKTPLEFDIELPEPYHDEITEYYTDVRKLFIDTLQDRRYSVGERLSAMGTLAEILNKPFLDRSPKLIRDALAAAKEVKLKPGKQQPCAEGLDTAMKLLSCFENKHSLYEYAEKASAALDGGENAEQYINASEKLYNTFPDFEIMAEQLFVNHVFYEGFPFGEAAESVFASYASLCSAYALWKTVAVGCCLLSPSLCTLTDLTSAAFRLIENSNYDLRAAALLNDLGRTSKEKLALLCSL